MKAVPRNDIIVIPLIVLRAFCAVPNGTLNKKKKSKKKVKIHLKRLYGDIANIEINNHDDGLSKESLYLLQVYYLL
jgi:hypothetical protein